MITALYRSPVLLLTLTAMMWAMNAVIGQLIVGEITPFAVVFLRWVMVAAVMWPLFGREVKAHWPVFRGRMVFIILAAVAGFTGFNTLFYIASAHTTGINIGILQGAIPVVVLLGAFIAYRAPVGWMQILGVMVTLLGVMVVASRGEASRLAALAFNQGDLIMLLACLCYAAYTVALRRRPEAPGAALFAIFAIVAAISAAPLALWEAMQPGYPWPTMKGLGLTCLVAIFPSCLAQLFFLRGVDLIGPGRAGVYVNLVPVFAAVFSIIVLGEQFAPFHAVAMALVLGGIWLAQRKG